MIWNHFHLLTMPVELPGDEFDVLFAPAIEQNSVSGLTFEYRPRIAASTFARLCPLQPRDHGVIPIAASSGLDTHQLWTVWIIALSELARFLETLVELHNDERRSSAGESTERHLRAASTAFVRPFVRRLPEGQHHSSRAAANARARGITLGDGETVVTEHVRNGADQQPIRIDAWTSTIGLHEIGATLPRAA